MTHRKTLFALLPIAAASFLAGPAEADSLRCGRHLVSSGDSLYQVRSTCGEPDDSSRHSEFRTVRRFVPGPCRNDQVRRPCGYYDETTVEVVVDQWTYDFGSRRFVQYLRFEQGELVRVASGSYGRKD
jgi:hypothetical protein